VSEISTQSIRPQPLIIASAANERYGIALGVVMCSALLCADDREVKFYVIDDGIQELTREMISVRVRSLAKALCLDVQLKFIDFSSHVLPPLTPLHGTLTAYARIFLPSLLTEDSVFYVDADIICNRRFSLFEETIEKQPKALLIGCQDPKLKILKNDCPWAKEIDVGDHELPYVNTGFLYMNLKNLRLFGLEGKFYDLAKDGKQMRFADQTALNFLCRGQIALAEPEFNILWSLGQGFDKESICNIHFVGSVKPWDPALKRDRLPQVLLFHSTAHSFGFESTKFTNWDETRIHFVFRSRTLLRMLFYKIASSGKGGFKLLANI
jgi:lipopolysaccharide biosynthesis glycosyltransferase